MILVTFYIPDNASKSRAKRAINSARSKVRPAYKAVAAEWKPVEYPRIKVQKNDISNI